MYYEKKTIEPVITETYGLLGHLMLYHFYKDFINAYVILIPESLTCVMFLIAMLKT